MSVSAFKKHFPILIEQDVDGFFIVSCPLFKDCNSYGTNIDDALLNIQKVIETCMEERYDEPSNTFIGIRDIELSVVTAPQFSSDNTDNFLLESELKAANLDRWKSSKEPKKWVMAHSHGWNHDEWVELLVSLKNTIYWPMDEAAIGQHIEMLKEHSLSQNLDGGSKQLQVNIVREGIIQKNGLNVIEKFLNCRNIKIKTVLLEDASDEVINALSEFLGKNYDGLRELLAKIKRNMQQGGFITLSIKDYTQKDVSNICQFSTRLHEIAFLEQYKYFKSPQYLIRAKTSTLPTAQNFFSGKWLERFVLLSVQRAVDLVSKELEKEPEFSYLLNPQVILPNGDDFELDLIFHVNGIYYWIESKSGDYQQHISKYSKISRILNLDFEHSIMVLTDISPGRSSTLASLFSMTVLSLSQLEEKLMETLKAEIGSS